MRVSRAGAKNLKRVLLCVGFAVACPRPGVAAQPEVFDINGYVVEGNTVLQPRDIELAVTPWLGPGRRFDDVSGARGALEQAYHDRGYQAAVEIPRQSVRNGVIRLQVAETRVGHVRVEGARYYSPLDIRDAVPALNEGSVPDLAQAEREILALNSGADRQVTPLLRPGRLPGTIDVDLKVSDALPLHGSAEINNDHGQDTPELRASASVHYDNLWQLGHSVSAGYVVSPQDSSAVEVITGSYLAPLRDTPWKLYLSGYHSNSTVSTLGGTSVFGKGYTLSLRAIYGLPSGERYTQTLSLGVDYKHVDETIEFTASDRTQTPLRYWPLTEAYNLRVDLDRSSTNAGLTFTNGVRGAGSDSEHFENSRALAESNFFYARIDADHLQRVGFDVEAAARVSAQMSDKPLVSNEQFIAGGARTVRGYLQSEAIGDKGVVASLELRSPQLAAALDLPLLRDWRMTAFYDFARVVLLQPLPEQRAAYSLASAGVGARVQISQYVFGDLDYAWPLVDGQATSAGASRLHFNLRSEF